MQETVGRPVWPRSHANVTGVIGRLELPANNGLYRSEEDIRELLGIGCRIRLVKGAYKEPARIAFRRKKDVDANFIKLMKILLPSGICHALATHDPKMIEAAIRFAAEQNITKDKFEFQMLYGIRTDLQSRLVRQGYRVRVYIPFGPKKTFA